MSEFLKKVEEYRAKRRKVKRILNLVSSIVGLSVTTYLLFHYDWELIVGIILMIYANNLSRA